MEDKEMKKFLAVLASIAMMTVCSTAAFAAGEVGDTTTPGACTGEIQGEGESGGTNVPTGVVLTVVPVALAAGALTVSGIVLKKKNK